MKILFLPVPLGSLAESVNSETLRRTRASRRSHARLTRPSVLRESVLRSKTHVVQGVSMNLRPSDSPIDEEARRITACLKACEGIPTEALEAQVILRLVAACVPLRDPRLREVLEEMSGRPARRPRRRDPRSLQAVPLPRPMPPKA